MSITSDLMTARSAASEAQAWGDSYAKVLADVLRRVVDSHDRLEREVAQLKRERHPKNTRWPQDGFSDTHGEQGL